MTFFFITALAAFASVANALSIVPRGDCSSIPPVDTGVRNQIVQVATSMGVNENVMVCMMSAAITESNVNNLRCGDKDSQGVFQQRPSQGWGSIAQITDVAFATRSFLNVAIGLDKSHPGTEPGVLAQMVQNAEAGNQYTKNVATARQYIAAARAALGQPSKPAAAPATSSDKPKPTAQSTKSAASPAAATSKPASGAGGAANVGSKPTTAATTQAPQETADSADSSADPGLPEGCVKSYQPVKGDTCLKVAAQFGITLDHFYEMNPCIDELCHNLQVTFPYCVGLESDA